jgi:hypothetical protein
MQNVSFEKVHWRRYLCWFGATMLFVVVAVCAANYFVDPYGVFGAPEIYGFNRIKVRAGVKGELFKTQAVRRLTVSTVVLGNSRAEVGFDPESAEWPAAVRPIFNMAQPGTGLASMARMLSASAATNRLSTVIMGLDFPNFLNPSDSMPIRTTTAVAAGSTALTRHELGESLLSIDSLFNSIATLAGQRDPFAARLTDRGFNPMLDYRKIAAEEGYASLFRQKNAEYAEHYVSEHGTARLQSGQLSADLQILAAMLRYCAEQHIRVELVIYPYHADLLEILQASNHWGDFEDWKRLLVGLLEQPPLKSAAIRLWDFGQYSEYTTEPVPSRKSAAAMRGYWESGHFKSELGNLVLHDIFADAPVFGVRLTPQNLEDELQRARILRDGYRAARPERQQQAQRLVDSIKARK